MLYLLHSDSPATVEMNGKLTEDKSEDTDCDGSSLPEDFSEVRWQKAGRHVCRFCCVSLF